MKRRQLMIASAGAAGLALPALVRAVQPCPPPVVNVQNGTSATTNCVAAPSPGPATIPGSTFSSNFAAVENPISESGKWVCGKAIGLDWNNPKTTGGKAVASIQSGFNGASRYNDSIAHVSTSAATFPANQFAQATVYRASGYSPGNAKHEVELLLRFQITAHGARGYEILWGHSGYFAIVKWNGALGSYAALVDTGDPGIGAPVDGDVLRAEIIGNVIKAYKNGALVATAPADSTWTSGQPGIGFWPVDGAVPENMGWKTFAAGGL